MTAYWIAHVTVTDPEAYQGYQALAPAAFAAHGARFLARGGAKGWQRILRCWSERLANADMLTRHDYYWSADSRA